MQVVEQSRPDSEALTITVNSSKTDILVDELKKWTDYRVWISAGSSVGDNPPTPPIVVRTDEDGAFRHVQFTHQKNAILRQFSIMPSTFRAHVHLPRLITYYSTRS
jgi:hypothetical protein